MSLQSPYRRTGFAATGPPRAPTARLAISPPGSGGLALPDLRRAAAEHPSWGKASRRAGTQPLTGNSRNPLAAEAIGGSDARSHKCGVLG